MALRETENNAYAKFWRDKQRPLWYVMVFLEWSINATYAKEPNLSRQQQEQIYIKNLTLS